MLQANDVVVCVPALHLSKQYAESVLFCPKNKWKMGFEGGNGNVVTEGLGMGIYMG